LKDYKQFWRNVLKYASQPVKKFKIDIDDMPKHAVLRIARHLKASFAENIDNVKIWQNTKNKRHFHLEVSLKNPIPFYQAVLARILAFDDIKRLRLDLIRCGNNQFHLADYISNKKYVIPPDSKLKNKSKLISKYALIGVLNG